MNKNFKKGYTLIEIIIVIAILGLVFGVVSMFQRDVFTLNRTISSGLNVQHEVKKIIRPFANEVRSAQNSPLGAFPIIQAASSTFSFYSDIDNDGNIEKVRYFLEDSSFKKGVIDPSGNPVTYDSDDEVITHIINDVLISQPIFTYYDASYTGLATSTPISSPVAPVDVRLIKVNLIVDQDGDGINPDSQVTTQVTLRNLKDNY